MMQGYIVLIYMHWLRERKQKKRKKYRYNKKYIWCDKRRKIVLTYHYSFITSCEYKVYVVLTLVDLVYRCHGSWEVMIHVWIIMLKLFIIDQMFRRHSMPVMVTIWGIGVFASTYYFIFTFFFGQVNYKCTCPN